MSVKVSVIMPVYNAAEFLGETLESVLNQSLDDYEVIAVNDGSKDNSLEILEQYAQQYSNLSIINQENAGPSAARNAGLDAATGKYIYFPDADDLLNKKSLQQLYERAENNNADMVIARYDIFNSISKTKVTNINVLTEQEEIGKYDQDILWTFSLCNKLFKRDIIEKHHFRFPPVSYSEDGVFVMRYVYIAEKIVGLPKVVFHYRRENDTIHTSITSSVSKGKIHDYLQAHEWIYEAAVESFLRDNPEYTDIETLMQDNMEVHDYLNQFFKKEMTVLFNQFYKKFWSQDEETVAYMAEEIEKLLKRIDAPVLNSLIDIHYELNLHRLYRSYQEALDDAKLTVLLYGDKDHEEKFTQSLIGLCAQNMIPLKIVVPEQMRETIDEKGIRNQNIVYMAEEERTTFWYKGYEACTTPYIIFGDMWFNYAPGSVKEMYIACETGQYDFGTYRIYYADAPKSTSVSFQSKAVIRQNDWRRLGEYGNYELFLENKIFSVKFLQSIGIGQSFSGKEIVKKAYDQALYYVSRKKYVALQGSIQNFLYDVLNKEDEYKRVHAPIDDIDLADSMFEADEREVSGYVPCTDEIGVKGNLYRFILNLMCKLPLKNRAFIVSIRKDGELEGNAKALVDAIDEPKVICAKMLPHDEKYKLKMYYYVATSKVIITDDYLRYLRVFPLRKEQRVIQLWHACGVFKKFGIQGTTLDYRVDRSTHVQYNTVCVSSDEIRPTYAEAFQISMDRVQALGCPRTDIFFDKERIEQKKKEVYEKYPELLGKRVILYAPTFRDRGGNRSVFKPEIDFERLSKELLDDQVFVICPHPVMKNEIVDKVYDNIKVIRDVSTNDMMFVSNMMVTDYSSVIFEYALLRKPIVFYCYDRDAYDRGFYLDYNTDLPGEIVESFDEFVAFLKDEKRHALTSKYDDFVNKYMSACDGHSTERIAKLVNDYMKG